MYKFVFAPQIKQFSKFTKFKFSDDVGIDNYDLTIIFNFTFLAKKKTGLKFVM